MNCKFHRFERPTISSAEGVESVVMFLLMLFSIPIISVTSFKRMLTTYPLRTRTWLTITLEIWTLMMERHHGVSGRPSILIKEHYDIGVDWEWFVNSCHHLGLLACIISFLAGLYYKANFPRRSKTDQSTPTLEVRGLDNLHYRAD